MGDVPEGRVCFVGLFHMSLSKISRKPGHFSSKDDKWLQERCNGSKNDAEMPPLSSSLSLSLPLSHTLTPPLSLTVSLSLSLARSETGDLRFEALCGAGRNVRDPTLLESQTNVIFVTIFWATRAMITGDNYSRFPKKLTKSGQTAPRTCMGKPSKGLAWCAKGGRGEIENATVLCLPLTVLYVPVTVVCVSRLSYMCPYMHS